MALNPNKSGSGGGGLLDPENFGEGLWTGGRAKILAAMYQLHQFPGSTQPRQPMAYIKFKDASGAEHEEYWKFGSGAESKFKVIDGGARVQAVNGNKVNKSTAVSMLMASIEATQWEWAKPGDNVKGTSADITELKGYTVEVERVVRDVGEKIKADRAKAGNKNDITTIIVKAFVGEPGKGEGKAASSKAELEEEAAEETPAEGVDLDQLLTKLVTSILSEQDGNKAPVEELQAEVLRQLEEAKEDPDSEYHPLTESLDEIVTAAGDVADDGWLTTPGGFTAVKGKKKSTVAIAIEAPKVKKGLGKK